jgi:hypothetical protein
MHPPQSAPDHDSQGGDAKIILGFPYKLAIFFNSGINEKLVSDKSTL